MFAPLIRRRRIVSIVGISEVCYFTCSEDCGPFTCQAVGPSSNMGRQSINLSPTNKARGT